MNRAVELYRAALEQSEPTSADAIPGNFEYESLRTLTREAPALAAIQLGEWYEHGSFVQTDYAEALRLYRLAAEKGNPAAARHLAVMYETGKGVSPDDVEAEKWFIVDASRPGSYQGERDRLAMKLTGDQLIEARRRAAEWLLAFPLKD